MKLHEDINYENKEIRKGTVTQITNSFLSLPQRIQDVHKDTYLYHNFIFKSMDDKGLITCPIHGDFPQSMNKHLNAGRGCPDCGTERNKLSLRRTKDEFISEAIAKYGDKYDYSLVEYVDRKTEVIIICPVHGETKQTPRSHLSSEFGCTKCAYRSSGLKKRKELEVFILEAIAVHGNKYDYSLVEYNGAHELVTIICPIHGNFDITPHSHTFGESGCSSCGGIASNIKVVEKARSEFEARSRLKHGNKYNYDNVEYFNSITPVKIWCIEHQEFFYQTPANHYIGTGCKYCISNNKDSNNNRYKKYYDLPTLLYYIKIIHNNKIYWKIGITTKTVEERFRRDKIKIEVLNIEQFDTGKKAYLKEQLIINSLREFAYKGEHILRGGNSELFIEDCYLR